MASSEDDDDDRVPNKLLRREDTAAAPCAIPVKVIYYAFSWKSPWYLSLVTFSYALLCRALRILLRFFSINFPSSTPIFSPLSARDDSRSCIHVLIPCDFIYDSLSLFLRRFNKEKRDATKANRQKRIQRHVVAASYVNFERWGDILASPCPDIPEFPPRDDDTRFPNK